jgi:hypothetical protein
VSEWIYGRTDVWRLLIVDKPLGPLQSRLLRWPTGVRFPAFYPDLTTNPVPPPERLTLLLATVDRLAAAASQPVERSVSIGLWASCGPRTCHAMRRGGHEDTQDPLPGTVSNRWKSCRY